jgi:Mn-dependent DtxR family transcriptional regulator
MSKKLDILKLFAKEDVLTPAALANLFNVKPNNARQIILRLKNQGLIFPYPRLDGPLTYGLTSAGQKRIKYLSNKQQLNVEQGKKDKIEKRNQTAMHLLDLVRHGLPATVQERIRSEFNMTIDRLGEKTLDELIMPQEILSDPVLSQLGKDVPLKNILLPFAMWVRLLQSIKMGIPKLQTLSIQETALILESNKQGGRDFFVAENGQIFTVPGNGRLTMQAAALLSACRQKMRHR